MSMNFEFREMTEEEFKREQQAFDEHGQEFGNPPDKQERFTFVATDDGKFVGTSSGLAQKTDNGFGEYFYLSDLLVEKRFRKMGYGKKLLKLLEAKVKDLGIMKIWTWTAEYEASTFYQQQGYKIFATFDKFYSTGHARVGLIKNL